MRAMDERWLWYMILVTCCAVSISAAPDLDDYVDLLDDDYWDKLLDHYLDEPISKPEETPDEEKNYVGPEEGDSDDEIPYVNSDDVMADTDVSEAKINVGDNDIDLVNKNDDLVSDNGYNDTDEQNDMEKDTDEKLLDESSEQIIDEKIDSNSEENADKVLEAIQQALSEDEGTLKEDKLDADYQVEDNRSQVQNKFDEVNEEEEDVHNVPQDENVIDDIQEGDDNSYNGEEDIHGEIVQDTSSEFNENGIGFENPSEETQDNKMMHLDSNEVNQNDNTDNKDIVSDNFPEPVYDDHENIVQSNEVSHDRNMVEDSLIDKSVQSDEDTVDKVYEDLKEDLNELFDTLDKLTDNDSKEASLEESFEDRNSEDNENIAKEPLSAGEVLKSPEESDTEDFDYSAEERILKTRQDYYDSMKDYPFVDHRNEDTEDSSIPDKIIDQNIEAMAENQKENLVTSEKFVESNENEEIIDQNVDKEEDNKSYKAEVSEVLPISLFNITNDNLVDNEQQLQNVGKKIENTGNELQGTDEIDHVLDKAEQALLSNVNQLSSETNSQELKDLTSAEVNSLMTKFVIDHANELDVNSANFDQGVAPIYITLKVGEAVVIESPNYPNVYPSNNIIDWIIDGEGTGIEMNVTDVALNGFLGDYLLVKPGGIDESGTEGLIFSYQLRSERRYRFLDVNRVFIRFQSQLGMSLLDNRGFRLSLKLLMPLSEGQAPIPQPEAIVQPPQQTMQVYLAGVSPNQFTNQSEAFRLIVADMATLYINRMELELEDFNAKDVTQLTQTATCNVNWPGFERCVGVSFGVPLPADDEDEEPGLTTEQLHIMWSNFVDVDPFAARLRRLGITEFAIPNDRSTLLVWLIIGAGVAISAGMLALALWRWSCFEDYTRMPAFSDTDSVISEKKRHLDLYPTPHQTLPPLYDDDFVKYEDTARVDMGGFANKSFAREGELLDLESDDDLGVMPVQRDRSSNIKPKDIFQV